MKLLKRIVGVFLMCAMLVADTFVVEASDVKYISSESELKAIAKDLSGDYVLTADIVLSGEDWNNLGKFKGTLDGAGHTISGFTSAGDGLFWYITGEGVVKNLTISGKIAGETVLGGFFARINMGTLADCVAKGSIESVNSGDAGGVVGYNYGHMKNCRNEATILNGAGGVVGNNMGTMTSCVNEGNIVSVNRSPGGVAGVNNYLLEECENYGSITTTYEGVNATLDVGGIVGTNAGLILQCINYGKIEQPMARDAGVGGIAGTMHGYSQIIACENRGEVSGVGYLGGICGEASLDIGHFDENDDFVVNNGGLVIADCKNSGEVYVISKENVGVYSGGILGEVSAEGGILQVLDCENSGTIRCLGNGDRCAGIVGSVCTEGKGAVKLQGLVNHGSVVGEIGEGGNTYAAGIFAFGQNFTENSIEVRFCKNTGKVEATYAYGIAGQMPEYCIMEYCGNSGDVTGRQSANGITEVIRTGTIISDCYNIGTLSGKSVVGLSNGYKEAPILRNSYLYGELMATDSEYVSRQLGNLIIENCYYMEQELLSSQSLGTVLSSTEMEQAASYTGFDFENVWEMQEQSGKLLPTLKILPGVEFAEVQATEVGMRVGEVFTPEVKIGTLVKAYSSNYSCLGENLEYKLQAERLGECTVYHVFSDGQIVSCTVYITNSGRIPVEPSAEVIAFVDRMYTVVLGREAETEGLAFWTSALANYEVDGAGLAAGFVMSQEFYAKNLSNEAYLEVVYQTFFGRGGDEGGTAFWKGALEQGVTREAVMADFVNSQEFSAICDEYKIARGTMQSDGTVQYNQGVREFVLRMYTKVLERNGETMGVEYWTNEIVQGYTTPEAVAREFCHSNEYVNKNTSNTQYVEMLYQLFMDRVAEEGGKAYWVEELDNGMSRDSVIGGFADSEEFKAIMAEYGL